MTGLGQLTAYRVTRPVRALVLVDLPDEAPWQVAMMAALRGQAATWGGSANLVVPWTDDVLERDELWAIARALDPDAIAFSGPAGSDLDGIVPDDSPRGRTGSRWDDDSKRDGVRQKLATRLPVFQNGGQVRPIFSGDDGNGFPCTPVTAIKDLDPVCALRCSADLDAGLLLAAEAGDLANATIGALADRGTALHPVRGK